MHRSTSSPARSARSRTPTSTAESNRWKWEICSGGLNRTVADAEMADILARGGYHQAAEALLALSLSRQPQP